MRIGRVERQSPPTCRVVIGETRRRHEGDCGKVRHGVLRSDRELTSKKDEWGKRGRKAWQKSPCDRPRGY